MKIIVCAVIDRAMQSFAQPMFFPTTGIAVRSFSDAVNTPDANSNLNKHPDDFELWQLATFDDVEGQFDQVTTERRCLMRGKDAKRNES